MEGVKLVDNAEKSKVDIVAYRYPRLMLGVRTLYVYFYVPVLAIMLVLIANTSVQFFFEFVLPAVDTRDTEEHRQRTILMSLAQFVLFVLMPFIGTKAVKSIINLMVDGWSKYEHPRLRAILREMITAVPFLNASFVVGVMAVIPFLTAGLWVTFSHEEEMWRATIGVSVLLELEMAVALYLYLMDGRKLRTVDEQESLEMRIIVALKVLHLIGGFLAAVFATKFESVVATLSWYVMMMTFITSLYCTGYVILLLSLEVKYLLSSGRTYERGIIYWALGLAVTMGLAAFTARQFSSLTAGGFIAFAAVTALMEMGSGKPVLQPGGERSKLTHRYSPPVLASTFLFQSIAVALCVAFLMLSIISFLQEAAIFDLKIPASKFVPLVMGANYTTGAVLPRVQFPTEPHNPEDTQYAICANRWHGLSIVDLALFADLAYVGKRARETSVVEDELADTRAVLGQLFDPADWSVKGKNKPNDFVVFRDLYSKSKNLSVISVRGTVPLRFIDAMQDFHLFTGVISLQVISIFVPLTVWPDRAVSQLILAGGAFHSWFPGGQRHYYDPVLNYTLNIKDRNVLLTGHSLGGSVAAIVGCRSSHTAIMFSSPGLTLSHKRLNITREAISRYLVNVAPSYDPITAIDKMGGLVQHTMCEKLPNKCHNMENTVCDLAERCRDWRSLHCDLLA